MFHLDQPIATSRLIIRPFTPADEDDMFDFESRDDVARYLFNEPRTREDNAEELAKRVTQAKLENDGDTLLLAVDYNGTVIGYVLLTLLSRDNSQGEFGYVLHPEHQGKGLASEAAVEMLRLGFETLNLHRIIGRCDPRNDASARLMERLGLRKEAHFRELEIFKGEWGDELTFAMLKDEWDQRKHTG
ncbi:MULTISPECIES: GNAT family N-acetyltransferase [Auritidibacter]|uniref:GNAT family N-acetyltransferase n=1 Tax=Auritidibacter TaxID=1160973 RepID=UPI000D738A35|nr:MULTISPECIES: GNAT family N-acetyltransferase [Auritidibacter]AXR73395.1 N-acetyltransferase [Auritidibacter sp. NML130574]WGH84232.1 GNAT family N-acetyltransferase [Auritidibacter ignavus]